MKAIKSAGHHWWPEGLSRFWADQRGQVHRVSFDGELIASQPKSFGVESNANRIKISPEPSVWDSSFENAYDRADDAFPGIVAWLQTLQPPPACDGPWRARFTPHAVSELRLDLLAECLASLISRSPNFRHRIRLTTEFYRKEMGLSDPKADKALIGLNVRESQKNFHRAIRNGGKCAILFAGEGEFVFGDGFLHNFVNQNQNSFTRSLIPITPEIAVFHCRPREYRTYPKVVALTLQPEEVDTVNFLTQAYSKRFLFFREIYPVIQDAFRQGEHLQTEYHKHPLLEDLQAALAQTAYGDDRQFYA